MRISLALRGDGALLAVGDRTGAVTLIDTSHAAVVGTIQPLNRDSENLVARHGVLARRADSGNRLAGRNDLALVGRPATTAAAAIPSSRAPRAHHQPGLRRPKSPPGQRGHDPLVEVWDLELLDRELIRLGLAD